MRCVSLEIFSCLALPLSRSRSLFLSLPPSLCLSPLSPLSASFKRLGPSCLNAAVASQIAVISFNLSQRQRRWLRRRQQQMLPLAAQIVFVARLNTHTNTHTHKEPQPQPVQNAHKKSAACPCSSAVNTMRHIPHGNTPLPSLTQHSHAHASRPSTTSAACCAPMHNCCLYEKISPNGVLHYLPPDAAVCVAVAVAATATANCCQVAEAAVSLTGNWGVRGARGALSNCES